MNGTITDTDVTFGRNLTVKGALSTVGSVSQVAPGPANVPFTIYGAQGQTADLLDVRAWDSTLLFSVNAGGTLVMPRISDYTLAAHNHTTPAQGGQIGAAAFGGFEALYAGSWVNVSANYTVAANVLWVFCTAGVQVTLPAAASSNRPIEVVAVSGQSTVVALGGSVLGGSINTSNGQVMNGTVSAGDSITYKSDGVAWRAV